MSALHLMRRAVGSVRNNPLTPAETSSARSALLESEFELWSRMQHRDQRHSLQVLRRFDDMVPGAAREERAAVLLHDVGKAFSGLGWAGRIVATLIGPRTESMRTYLDHESIGVVALRGVSSARTLEVLDGSANDAVVEALRRADDM